jgi:ribosomal protein L12E/L44/L45/RPP1/RPP2
VAWAVLSPGAQPSRLRPTPELEDVSMKKMLLGLTAVFAFTAAAPAFAGDPAAKEEKAPTEKPAKKAKKGKGEEKAPEGEAAKK